MRKSQLRLPAAGLLALSCAAPGAAQNLPSFVPTTSHVVLDTDRTVIETTVGPRSVVGGVFYLHDVRIPPGATVSAVGTRPLVFVLTGSMQVEGVLSVAGGDGEHANHVQAANEPVPGGRGGPAGGNGGASSVQTTQRSFAGEAGDGPGGTNGLGGTGGIVALRPTLRGSGGGGGAFATAGDPYFGSLWTGGTSFIQQVGLGGFGGAGASGSATRTLPGGGPGGSPFQDAFVDNDFFGVGFDVFRNRIVVGELPLPTGGSGGGGGGDMANSALGSSGWIDDHRGGGGGGGGGCLIVYAATRITISGRISANGGNGGGGEFAGTSKRGGGGGGGSGGMVILAAGQSIDLEVRGETYANRDYDFLVSADGGISRTSLHTTPVVLRKYPLNGLPTLAGVLYDDAPRGGLGGMGVVQFVTPPGVNSDGTNTALDDNVRLYRFGVEIGGAEKQRYLAWRGYDNGQGVLVDDFGVPTAIGANEGDIRPSPVLMPLVR